MSNQTLELKQKIEKPKRKSILKRWWFWLLAVVALIIIISIISSGGGSTAYELSKMQTMNKQQIVEKFGKPDEIVRDDSEGYIFAYHTGFMVNGTDNGATDITLQKDMMKKNSSDTYKIFDVSIGSSFDENVTRLGKPNLSSVKDGKKNALYLTKEDFLLLFSTDYNSDKIAGIHYVSYIGSQEATSLDISKMLGLKATEDEISKMYTIKDKTSSKSETMYNLESFQMVLDNQSQLIKKLFISTDSIYNIHGVRTNDSLDRANQIFGKPLNTSEGVKNTTRYSYTYDGRQNPTTVNLSADNTNNKIGFIEVMLK